MECEQPPHTPDATPSLPGWTVCFQTIGPPFLKLFLIKYFFMRLSGTGAICGLNVKCPSHPHRLTWLRTWSLASATVSEAVGTLGLRGLLKEVNH